jgi:hypothetical protein
VLPGVGGCFRVELVSAVLSLYDETASITASELGTLQLIKVLCSFLECTWPLPAQREVPLPSEIQRSHDITVSSGPVTAS